MCKSGKFLFNENFINSIEKSLIRKWKRAYTQVSLKPFEGGDVMAELKWEIVESTAISGRGLVTDKIDRAKVPGGWLVAYKMFEGGGLTFVPDPDHTWK